VTADVLLSRLLKPETLARALDRSTIVHYKLAATLDELESRLDAELAAGRPLLVYTQPQDLHISVLVKEKAAYDERVRAVDAAFGRLLETLKRRGLYDQSVIVLTSDHGDSLGEGGRWGHAYTLYPEIVRVPLIVRLPPALRAGLAADLESPAFLTDLVPSLRAALGLPPEGEGEPWGRALYGPSPEALAATRRPERLLGSSYGPVWGVLGGGGEWLFVCDAVEFKSRWYDLKNDPDGRVDLIDPAREALGRERLARRLESLRGHYRY
jgi:arylsulfatase A-like enzyme